VHLNSFSTVPRSSGSVFKFCAPGLVFGGTEGIGSRFHIWHAWTHFRRNRGRPIPFSSFPLLDMFMAVRRASGPVCMFCAPRHVFGGIEDVGFRFQVLSSTSGPIFMFCAPGLISDGTEGVGSRFHVFPARTHFRRNRGRRVTFSCFALPDSFSTLPRVSGPVLMFCAPGLVFSGTEGVRSSLHVLRSRTSFRQCRVRWVSFS
jgi:hypothetical protein